MLDLDLLTNPLSLRITWIFDVDDPDLKYSFLVPFDVIFLQRLIKTNNKYLRQKLFPVIFKRLSVKKIDEGIVVCKDDWLAWFFPDIPWQLFSGIGSKFSQMDMYLRACGDSTAWSLVQPTRDRPHVCRYETPEWIIHNELEADSFRNKTLSGSSVGKVKTANEEERWEALCRGWFHSGPYRGFYKTIKARYEEYQIALPISESIVTHFTKKKGLILTRKQNVISKATIPKRVRLRNRSDLKRDICGIITCLNDDFILGDARVTRRSLEYFFVTKDRIMIDASVTPDEIEKVFILFERKEATVKQLIYRRISEVPRGTLKALKALLPKLVCLRGDWNPNLVAEEVFGEVWHPAIIPETKIAQEVRQELDAIRYDVYVQDLLMYEEPETLPSGIILERLRRLKSFQDSCREMSD